MFLTDYHDVEMTMVSQNNVLSAVLYEYTDLPKGEHLQLRDEILKCIEMVGYLKWLNDKEDLGLMFKRKGNKGNQGSWFRKCGD